MAYDFFKNRKLTMALCAAGFAGIFLPSAGRAQITPSFTISTYAGNYTQGFSGDGSAATSAELAGPFKCALDGSGNLYIADQFNNRIRKVDTSGNITTVAGNGTAGYKGDGGAATSAELTNPEGVWVDSAGNLYIADTGNEVVRKVTTSGTISTIAGENSLGAGYAGDGAAATSAQLYNPSAVVVDAKGNVYIADTSNNIVRIVTTDGNINTYAGNYGAGVGFTGDGGAATSARMNNPEGLALDSAGNLYIADGNNNRVRMVTAATGIITTVAGSSTIGGYSGDGGLATKAKLNIPKGVAVDAAGNLYIADSYNSIVRLVNPAGIITTVAGNHSAGSGGDGQLAVTASLYFPSGVTYDPLNSNVFVVDNQNDVIRLLTLIPATPAIYPNGAISASAFGGFSAMAPGSWIEIYGMNLANQVNNWSSSFNGNNAPTSLYGTSVTVGGQAAYVDYISAGQVNVQLSSNTPTGSQPLVVTTPYGSNTAYTVTVNPTEPGLLAPTTFVVNGNQYVAALHADGATFVAPPGAIPGVTSIQAKPGETITIYGVGFGPVTPSIPAGQIVQNANAVMSPVTFSFGGTSATSVPYAGLAPQQVGLYQFNVVVPNIANSDLVPLTFTVGGTKVSLQTLYTAVHN